MNLNSSEKNILSRRKIEKLLSQLSDWHLTDKGKSISREFVFKDLEVEVIGNIYENPELLKGE